jgi:NAD(P)-dependent dehydrogenase (short-subunit alcohol dehydrogenase family)
MKRKTKIIATSLGIGAAGVVLGTGLLIGAAGLAVSRTLLRRRRHLNLRGKVVFITGGSRGLGLVLAREFAKRGAKVAICGRDTRLLERARREFEPLGENFLALTCDVRNQSDVAAAVTLIEAQLGLVDVLVNNAGTIVAGPMENQTLEVFQDVMATNFWGAVYATLAVLPGMKYRREGRIVNIASIGGKVAFPHLLSYNASKFALVGFSEGLRAELLKDDLFVTTVCPSLMRTGSPRNANFSGQHKKEYTWFVLSDSTPGISMGAQRAARKIVNACVNGISELHVGIPTKLASIVQGIAPGMMADMMGLLNRWFMPAPVEGGTQQHKGHESETQLTHTYWTKLTRAAEAANNQL